MYLIFLKLNHLIENYNMAGGCPAQSRGHIYLLSNSTSSLTSPESLLQHRKSVICNYLRNTIKSVSRKNSFLVHLKVYLLSE